MKKKDAQKNELAEIYSNTKIPPIHSRGEKGGNKFSFVGAMLGGGDVNFSETRILPRHVFSLHEGEFIYLKIHCKSNAEQFCKNWDKKHIFYISDQKKWMCTEYFKMDLIVPNPLKQEVYVRLYAQDGLELFAKKHLNISLFVGPNYSYFDSYEISLCRFEQRMLELDFSRSGFVYATDPTVEYISFKYGENRSINIHALCNNPWGLDYPNWCLFLEFTLTMTNEQGEVVYSHVGHIMERIDTEDNSWIDTDHLTVGCTVDDISSFKKGIYTSVINFMGITQHVMEFTIETNAKTGRQTYTLNPHETQKMVSQPIDGAMAQLEALIGLETIKKDIKTNLNYEALMNARKRVGLSTGNRILNMVYTGNPGTGKTTVCRLLGSLLKEIGILSKGHVIEANRESLIGQYIGETEKRTKSMIEKAKGGILFIDEAYSLILGGADNARDFGRHVIDTLMPILSEPDNDLIVVLAGYGKEMKMLLDSNPGLASRFPISYDFPDYTPAELMQIAMLYFETNQYRITDQARDRLHTLFEQAAKTPNFGNGRYVKTLIENTILPNMANRIVVSGKEMSDVDVISLIELSDIPLKNTLKLAPQRKSIGF